MRTYTSEKVTIGLYYKKGSYSTEEYDLELIREPNGTLYYKAYDQENPDINLITSPESKYIPDKLSGRGTIIQDLLSSAGSVSEHRKENVVFIREGYNKCLESIEEKIKVSGEQAEENKAQAHANLVESGKEIAEYFKEKKINVPQYICSVVRWLVAEEEGNAIKVLLGTLNTARGEATNIMAESASATGKTAIENAGFGLVHDHHHMTINFSTTASFRNQCITDPFMFQNKMVRLGDLGTEANQEVLAEVMGIIKILNSEGMYKATKMDNGEILHITLHGKTAMCFSKVANNNLISDQDKSRGVTYSPNPLNDDAFEDFAMWKNTPDFTNQYKELVDEYVTNIKDYIEYLIDVDVKVVNPYQKQISTILKKNKTYRRTLSKELWMMGSLALLNLPNKKVHEINGENVIYVSIEDVINYMTLYRDDLTANSNYDMDTHAYYLYLLLLQDYEPILDYDASRILIDELEETGGGDFDELRFKSRNKFFTINMLLEKYRGTAQLNNLISEVKDPNRKLRSVLHNMVTLVGFTKIPEDKHNMVTAPTMYFLHQPQQTNLLNKLVLDKQTLYLISNNGMQDLIPEIIEDFMSIRDSTETYQENDTIFLEFGENDCTILQHHEDIQKPPTIHIDDLIKNEVDDIWDSYFKHVKQVRREVLAND